MALRALCSRLPATHHHYHPSIILSKVRWTQRWLITPTSRFFSAEVVSSPSNLVQVYISRSTDPYLNLSIEHFLLQKSHPDSVVLLLYTNRPCIVIGRNQNPWVEVNLGLIYRRGILRQLRAGSESAAAENGDTAVKNGVREAKTTPVAEAEGNDPDDVLLVRRRSGGGTVFHDAGNVNYSVISPPSTFDRNKHAEMVVRALQGLRSDGSSGGDGSSVRVNERHDIVLDVPADSTSDPASGNEGGLRTFKISGSAYKLTRTRSLHHGTCLLSSPHLPFLGHLLRSPAAPYIKARGVESVRSPVRNVGDVSNAEFEDAVVAEFLDMYADVAQGQHGESGRKSRVDVEILDAAAAATAVAQDIPEVRAGIAELRSRDWIYAQTPQFTFSSHPTADDPRPRPDLPTDLPPSFFPTDAAHAPGLQMTVRHGQITEVVAPPSTDPESGVAKAAGSSSLVDSLKNLHLHHVEDWRTHVGSENESLGRWLNRLFGG
ncbi:hypothetical protein F4859DRAFT_225188 [Xylaria cf. heliscus]|nr:hypothetical protein F4859DRAFT_225188 [Xylaria cf. heliscus]